MVISFAAANTDPKLTEHREQLSGKAHLAFGAGPHACPAKDPAFMIAVTAVESLLNQLPDVGTRVRFQDLSWVPAPWSRSLVSVPIRFTPRSVTHTAAEPSRSQDASPTPATAAQHSVVSYQQSATHSALKPKSGLFSRFLAWTRGE